jgi:membrane protein
MNRIYEVEEGRPIWKLRPLQLAITVILVVVAAGVLAGLVVSGPVAQSVGKVIGVGATAVTVWNVVKWPVMLVIVALLVALLYYATPNVRQPKFRWISVGAGIAIIAWVAGSTAFAFYVAHFGSYNKTYGSLAGAVVFLLWLWLTNLALLFGAEIDAELERARELQAGMPAEKALQLPARDTRASDKRSHKRDTRMQQGMRLREHTHGQGAANTDE